MNNISEFMNKIMERKDVTQEEIAAIIGTSQSTLSKYLNDGMPKADTFLKFCEYFQIDLNHFLYHYNGNEADLIFQYRQLPEEDQAIINLFVKAMFDKRNSESL